MLTVLLLRFGQAESNEIYRYIANREELADQSVVSLLPTVEYFKTEGLTAFDGFDWLLTDDYKYASVNICNTTTHIYIKWAHCVNDSMIQSLFPSVLLNNIDVQRLPRQK